MDREKPLLRRFRLRVSNCYLLIGERPVLIDSGSKGEAKSILRAMSAAHVQPEDLSLILLTHGHLDHAGSAKAIADATGAPIALHTEDATWVRQGIEVPSPPVTAWARVLSRVLYGRIMSKVMSPPMFEPDIILTNAESLLTSHGVPGSIVHTPGHTRGSVSVILEDGRALVGDLAMNGLPSSPFKPTPPIVAQDPELVEQSWQFIRRRGATIIFPGHGAPFEWSSISRSENHTSTS